MQTLDIPVLGEQLLPLLEVPFVLSDLLDVAPVASHAALGHLEHLLVFDVLFEQAETEIFLEVLFSPLSQSDGHFLEGCWVEEFGHVERKV